MWKTFLAATAALAIAGAAPAAAQPGPGGPDRPRWQMSDEDIAAFAAARVAALKAGLTLNAEQERHWPAFENALKDLQRFRLERRKARREARRDDSDTETPAARMRRRAEALSGLGARLKTLADAQEPLYNSLDEAQKRRFTILARSMRRGPGWHRRHHWRERGFGPGRFDDREGPRGDGPGRGGRPDGEGRQ